MRNSLTLALVLVCSACAGIPELVLRDRDHPLAGRIWDPASATFIDEMELLRRAAQAEILLLGETHDNPEHHRLQRRILAARREAGARPALLMEQFDIDQQPAIDEVATTGGDLGPLMRGWNWSHYRGLASDAQMAGMPLRAANLPRAALRPVVRDGFSTLPAAEGERLGLNAAWDGARDKYLSGIIEASHCGKVSAPLRDGLVRAQRLRDATLADVALANIRHGVIFILGRGHARRDIGVPHYLETRRPGTRVLSIGLVEVSPANTDASRYEADRVGPAPAFDVIWFTARAERPDPCLAFGK
ncbi:MAG: ChaN family lipoprotein [Rhodocyclales bacterium]|nr:ChaN family lipoprotein [Rhodocyclales bacterium]